MKFCFAIILFATLLFSVPAYSQTANTDDVKTSQSLQASDCQQKNISQCMQIADGLLDRWDSEEALQYYQALCALNVGKGCRRVGWIYENVFENQPQLVKDMYQQACALDDMTGCNNLGVMHRVVDEDEQANKLFKQACDGQLEWGCRNLGDSYSNGWGGITDHQQAADFYQQACALELSSACGSAGDAYYELEQYAEALKWYSKACERNEGDNCYDVAYQYENGKGVKQNFAQANAFNQKACELEEGRGCTHLARVYMHYKHDNQDPNTPQDYVKGIALLETACSLGHGRGCDNLAFAYAQGHGVEKSAAKALHFYEYGCSEVDNYWGMACYNAAWYYEIGVTVARNIELAALYYEQACDEDIEDACTSLVALNNPLFVENVNEAKTPKVVFVTQKKFNGDLGGAIGADAKCQIAAEAKDSKVQGKIFKAWLSGERKQGSDEAKRVLLRATTPYQLVDGTILANSFKDLVVLEEPKSAINMLANGKRLSGVFKRAWTGLNERGELVEPNCSNWHSASSKDKGVTGDLTDTILWSDFTERKCSRKLRLYCFEQ